MFGEALLIVGNKTLPRVSNVLSTVAKQVRNRLYIKIQPPIDIHDAIPLIYLHASKYCSNVDVRVLLDDFPAREFEYTFCEEDSQVIDATRKKTPYDIVCLGIIIFLLVTL